MLWITGTLILLVDIFYRVSFPSDQLFDPISANASAADLAAQRRLQNHFRSSTGIILDEKGLIALIDRIKGSSPEEAKILLEALLAGQRDLVEKELNQTNPETTSQLPGLSTSERQLATNDSGTGKPAGVPVHNADMSEGEKNYRGTVEAHPISVVTSRTIPISDSDYTDPEGGTNSPLPSAKKNKTADPRKFTRKKPSKSGDMSDSEMGYLGVTNGHEHSEMHRTTPKEIHHTDA